MSRKRAAKIRRFASSAVIALPMTVALLFLMTRLILPTEQDRIVTRMIRNIEFQRSILPPDPGVAQVFEPPPPVEDEPPPIELNIATAGANQPQDRDLSANEISVDNGPAHAVDWWAEVRRLTQESDEEALKRWLLEQGHERYVSIMQGPLPITNSVHAKLPRTQEDETGYLNSFGDMEYKISENCVATTQVAARLDQSDFARALPMRITCKPRLKQKFSFDRDDDD